MPFDWMHPPRPEQRGDPFRRQFERTIAERARLFFNLGYGVDEATERIRAALRWEFDPDIPGTPLPPFYREVPDMVASVYARATPNST